VRVGLWKKRNAVTPAQHIVTDTTPLYNSKHTIASTTTFQTPNPVFLGGHMKKEAFFRIGQGYDVHRLTPERKLILGGTEIPHTHGLAGHSNADVLCHAIMDALLGAAGLGDIGQHFPDTDPQWKNALSLNMLEKVGTLLYSRWLSVSNIDATVIAQAPKLAPFRVQMETNIARALHITPDMVNVKFTTEEGLGFTGAGEGIAAQAVCIILLSK
jgi:2-C-methyl-D-erythritol 2,4-cyclodiphosphate synthase